MCVCESAKCASMLSVSSDDIYTLLYVPRVGSLQDMKHGKDGITSARKETECGLSFKRSPETREGDVIVCYKKNLVRSELTWSLSQYTKYEQKQP